MNEQLQNQLASILEYIKSSAGFFGEQAPLYVQELLNYGFFSA